MKSRKHKKYFGEDFLYNIFPIFFFLLDIMLKYLILHGKIPSHSNCPYAPGFLLVKNEGIMWGLLGNTSININAIMIAIYVFVIVIILFYFFFNYSKISTNRIEKFALYLLFFGIMGNLIDRILYKGVLDYLNFCFWPVFNFSDTMIVVAIFILLYVKAK